MSLNQYLHPKWKWNGHSLRRQWTTSDPAEMAKMKTALAADYLDCGCDPTAFGPPHTRSYVSMGKAMTSQCSSGGRWYNPKTEEMEGYAHCSCGECFD
jgi:hypothetical protein